MPAPIHRRERVPPTPPSLSELCTPCMSQKRCAFAYIDAHHAAKTKAGSPPAVLTHAFRAGLPDWLMGEQTASFSAQALADTTIAYVKPEVIVARLWKTDQRWMEILFNQLGNQILALKERLYFQTGEGAPGRVIHCLLHFVQQLRISAPTNIRLPIKLSRMLIAQLTGLSRETVSRVLTDLRQRRLLGGSDGKITIPDLEGLRNALNG
ncbi:MAG: helix-turn-helix domain-containing protein [Nitrospirae bacterium]|nr:helix-turn-helix domain-containing protein [Nitrospirota bacterium]